MVLGIVLPILNVMALGFMTATLVMWAVVSAGGLIAIAGGFAKVLQIRDRAPVMFSKADEFADRGTGRYTKPELSICEKAQRLVIPTYKPSKDLLSVLDEDDIELLRLERQL